MTPEEGIEQVRQKFKSAWLRVPLVVGSTAVNFTLDNFKRQGFLGANLEPWKPRKKGWGKKVRTGANILVDTGRLRRSIRITRITPDGVSIGSDVPYAKAHNEGLNIGQIQTVKSFTRKSSIVVRGKKTIGASTVVREHTRRINQKIPRRQFMGNSPYQSAMISRTVSVLFMKEIPGITL